MVEAAVSHRFSEEPDKGNGTFYMSLPIQPTREKYRRVPLLAPLSILFAPTNTKRLPSGL